MSVLSRALQGIERTPTRTANSWNFSTLSFDGSNSYPYSERFTFGLSDFNINPSGNLALMRSTYQYLDTLSIDNWDIANVKASKSTRIVPPLNGDIYSAVFAANGRSFIVSAESNCLLQYMCTVPWDVDSRYLLDGDTYIVPSFNNTVSDVFFKPDGTDFYVLDHSTNTPIVSRYPMYGNAFQVASGIYSNSVSLTGSFDFALVSLYLRPDGSEMFVLGDQTNTVYKYPLSTAWDITTVGSRVSFLNVTAQESSVRSVWFKPDGTAMYILGSERIYYYRIFIPWDSSSIAYQFSMTLPTNAFGRDFMFSEDGVNLYVLAEINNVPRIYQYILSTPWDLDTRVLTYTGLIGNTLVPTAQRLTIGDNGNKAILTASRLIAETQMSNAYQINTLSGPMIDRGIARLPYIAQSFDVDSTESRIYTVGASRLCEYALANAFSVASLQATSNISIVTSTVVALGNTGFDIYTADSVVRRYRMNTALDLSTATTLPTISVNTTSPSGVSALHIKPDDTHMYVGAVNKSMIFDYNLSVSNTATSATITTSNVGQLYLSRVGINIPSGLQFKPDGTRFFVGDSNGAIYEHIMSNPWDISSATWISTNFIGSTSTGKQFYISRDGKRFYLAESSFSTYLSHSTLGTLWSTSSDTYVTRISHNGENVVFKPDGTKYYSSSSSGITEFNLSTPWNLATAVQGITVFGSFSKSMYITPTGDAIYFAKGYNILKLPLNTTWDLASRDTLQTVFTQSQTDNPNSIFVKSEGDRVFLLDADRITLFSYTIG